MPVKKFPPALLVASSFAFASVSFAAAPPFEKVDTSSRQSPLLRFVLPTGEIFRGQDRMDGSVRHGYVRSAD